jgi:phytoene dehydrogenase-like protein
MVGDIPELKDYGIDRKHMKLSFGTYFVEDDSWIGVYGRKYDPTGEKTAKLFERFSPRDAETFMKLREKLLKYWGPADEESWFNLPPPPGQLEPFERLALNPEETGVKPEWISMSPLEVIADMFESPEVRQVWSRFLISAGYNPTVGGMGLLACEAFATGIAGSVSYPGGVHGVAHALQRVILENRGKSFVNSEVTKILVDNGKAKGIRLADGSEIEARQAVVSTPTPWHLVKLVGKEYFSERMLRRLATIRREYDCIAWYTWALHERPKYEKAEQFDPDIDGMDWISLGTKNPQDTLMDIRRHEICEWPDAETPGRMTLVFTDHSWADPSLAPPGKACVLTEAVLPPVHSKTPQQWKEFERRHADDVIRWWNRVAPNITWDTVIGYNPITPYHLSELDPEQFGEAGIWTQLDVTSSQTGAWRPCPELSRHRVPGIKGLYATGSSWGRAAYGGFGQGYTCYKAMAEDFGLTVPGPDKGRSW